MRDAIARRSPFLERFDPLRPDRKPATIEQYRARYHAFGCSLQQYAPVIDAACGYGHGTAELARTCGSAHGIDVDADVIAECRRRHQGVPGLTFAVADLTNYEFPPQYKAVVSHHTIEHLHDPYAAVRRMIRHADVLIIAWPLKANGNPCHVSQPTVSDVCECLAAWEWVYERCEPAGLRQECIMMWKRGE